MESDYRSHQLLDIYFRKEVIVAFDIRSGYINKLPNKLIVKLEKRIINRL